MLILSLLIALGDYALLFQDNGKYPLIMAALVAGMVLAGALLGLGLAIAILLVRRNTRS